MTSNIGMPRSSWEYERRGDEPDCGAVVDVGDWRRQHACPICGGEAYLHASPSGHITTHWHCGHTEQGYTSGMDDAWQTTYTIAIPGVPGPSLLGNARWWRWSHSDREAWRERVRRAVATMGIVPGRYCVRRVRIDWGKRSRVAGRSRTARFPAELGFAFALAGVYTASMEYPIDEEQSGVGGGTTWVTLERLS